VAAAACPSAAPSLAAPAVLYVGPGNVLTQDATNFTWDAVNKALKVGSAGTNGAFYVNGLPAIYEVPNASGNNWFEGNAGNFTVTGYGNLGAGDGALAQVSTGVSNCAIGSQSLNILTSGSGNTAVGIQALNSVTTGARNIGLGSSAGLLISSGTDNFALGELALRTLSGGGSNVAIGGRALFNLGLNSSGNVAIGQSCYVNLASGNSNVGIGGSLAGHWVTGTANILMGTYAGFNVLSGNYNTLIGAWQGPTAAISNVIALTDGNSVNNVLATDPVRGVDYNYTKANTWSFQYLTTPIGLHIYNTTDSGNPPVNYERGGLDWIATSNIFRLASQAGGTGTVRLIAIDGFQKAGAPAAGDLPSGSWALINDTSGGQTWLVYNNAGTIRKVQLV
jgi:hypothetical protein